MGEHHQLAGTQGRAPRPWPARLSGLHVDPLTVNRDRDVRKHDQRNPRRPRVSTAPEFFPPAIFVAGIAVRCSRDAAVLSRRVAIADAPFMLASLLPASTGV